MKVLKQKVFVVLFSIFFCQQNTFGESTTSISLESILNQMNLRNPIIFTPLEVKAGYLNYGGKNYWSGSPFNNSPINATDLPVLLDSTQYNFNIIDALKNRTGIFFEVDLLRTNLPHFLFHQNYIDFQIGIGAQFTNFSTDTKLPRVSGKEWKTSSSRGDYYFHPRSTGLNINTSLAWQLSRSRATYFYYSFGIVSISLYEL